MHRTILHRLVFFIIPCLLFYSCSFTSKQSLNLYKEASTKTYDIIVVPGVPPENGKWSYTMKGRILWSKYLYDKGIAKNIMYSGSAVYAPYKEGEVMALYAIAIGIPKEHVLSETKAEHSTENIYYSYKKAKQLGYKKIALASDMFQTKMLKRFTRQKVSADVDLIPMVEDSMPNADSMPDPVIDLEQTKVSNFVPITERESFWKRLRGTRGLNVDTTAYSRN